MAGDMTVGSLNVKLDMELNSLQAQITQANAKVAAMSKRMHSDVSKAAKAMNTALSSLGVGLSIAGVASFGKSVIDLGGQITDLSTQAGISTDAFQTLSVVAADSGVSGEQVAQAFVKMRKSIQDAATGSKDLQLQLAKLGLSAFDLARLSPERQFEEIAKAITNAKDKNAAFNTALDILGSRTAPKLTELLAKLGTDGFGKLNEETAKFRLSPEQLKTLDDAGDKLARMVGYVKVLAARGILGIGATKSSPVDDTTALSAGDSGDVMIAKQMASGAARQYGTDSKQYKEAVDEINRLQQAEAAAKVSADGLNEALAEHMVDLKALNTEQAAKTQQDSADAMEATITALADTDAAMKAYEPTLRARLNAEHELHEASSKASAELNKEAEQYRDIINPAHMYSKEIERVAELQRKGALTAGEAAAAIATIKQAQVDAQDEKLYEQDFDEILSGMEAFQYEMSQAWASIGDEAASAFAQIVVEGKASFSSLFTSISESIIQIAVKMAIINPLLNMMFGGVSGWAALPSFFGGAKAAGGPVSGGSTYLVGEDGPELFTPSSSGAIVPNHRLAGIDGGSGTTVYIDARGATEDAIAGIKQAMAALNASIEPRAVSAWRNSERRRK